MKWRPTTSLWLLIALALVLAVSAAAAAATADQNQDDQDAKLAALSDEQLAEAVEQLNADDKLVVDEEREIMTKLSSSMPDGVVKNQLRRMNMKHILHLEHLERLQKEMARRSKPAPAA